MSFTKTICSRHMSIGLWNKVAWFNSFHFFLKVDIKVYVCHRSWEAMWHQCISGKQAVAGSVLVWETLDPVLHVRGTLSCTTSLSPLSIMASLFMTSLLQRQWHLSAEQCTLPHCMSYTRMVLEAWKRFHCMTLTTKLPRLWSYTYCLCWPKFTLQNFH